MGLEKHQGDPRRAGTQRLIRKKEARTAQYQMAEWKSELCHMT